MKEDGEIRNGRLNSQKSIIDQYRATCSLTFDVCYEKSSRSPAYQDVDIMDEHQIDTVIFYRIITRVDVSYLLCHYTFC